MGMYVAVRGWLEFAHEQRAAVEEILAEHRQGPVLRRLGAAGATVHLDALRVLRRRRP